MRLKIDWASLIAGNKSTIFALFYYIFEAIFQVQVPRGLIFGEAIKRSFFCVTGLRGLYLKGLINGGAHFRNSTMLLSQKKRILICFDSASHRVQPTVPTFFLVSDTDQSHNTQLMTTGNHASLAAPLAVSFEYSL